MNLHSLDTLRMVVDAGFTPEDHHAIIGMLMNFANAVADAAAEAEREDCAKLCDNFTSEWTPEECAAAIRARGY